LLKKIFLIKKEIKNISIISFLTLTGAVCVNKRVLTHSSSSYFDAVWQAAGLDCCKNYDKDGKWVER